jgi:hypothetical protein
VSLTYWSLSKQRWNTACRYGFCVMTVGPQMKSSIMWLHTSAQVVTLTTPDSLGALPVQHLPDSCGHQSNFPTYILLPLPGGSSLWFYGEKLCSLSHYRIYVEGSQNAEGEVPALVRGQILHYPALICRNLPNQISCRLRRYAACRVIHYILWLELRPISKKW